MQLFEFAVIANEKVDKDGDVTERAELIVEPTTMLARDKDQAVMLAARAIPEDWTVAEKLDRVQVIVRPF